MIIFHFNACFGILFVYKFIEPFFSCVISFYFSDPCSNVRKSGDVIFFQDGVKVHAYIMSVHLEELQFN